ncbi:MAG: outer membrane protein assembly factor BamE [Proteobacteria bacterium]|jgi:outer membrane protein assembly factor BamE|nr:outer membrane protein assembly factor BamE [Pseudomonadota bacterium]MCG6934262.1 outer membrane protein assembly factor BamE [Pseudomonadota bacterium]
MRNSIISLLAAGLILLQTGGCIYKIDIQQGNSIDMEDVNSLRTGMTRQQVVFLMGTALVQDPFESNRWDYVYTFQPGGGDITKEHLTLIFENDVVTEIRRSPDMRGSNAIRKADGRF